jgi:hypothetical protein
MSKQRDRREADRRPSERRDGRDSRDSRDGQPDDDQQRRPTEAEAQEGDSLTALKAILAKVAALLKPLQLTQDESIRLVEQLYGSVLEMDVKLAGEADDARKSSVLAHIQNTTVTREGDKIVVDYPVDRGRQAEEPAATAATEPAAPATAPAARRPPATPAVSKAAPTEADSPEE